MHSLWGESSVPEPWWRWEARHVQRGLNRYLAAEMMVCSSAWGQQSEHRQLIFPCGKLGQWTLPEGWRFLTRVLQVVFKKELHSSMLVLSLFNQKMLIKGNKPGGQVCLNINNKHLILTSCCLAFKGRIQRLNKRFVTHARQIQGLYLKLNNVKNLLYKFAISH